MQLYTLMNIPTKALKTNIPIIVPSIFTALAYLIRSIFRLPFKYQCIYNWHLLHFSVYVVASNTTALIENSHHTHKDASKQITH